MEFATGRGVVIIAGSAEEAQAILAEAEQAEAERWRASIGRQVEFRRVLSWVTPASLPLSLHVYGLLVTASLA